jgi:hypothetical protein
MWRWTNFVEISQNWVKVGMSASTFCFCQLEANSAVDVVTKITLNKFCDQSNKQ